MIYYLYIFNREGTCIFYQEWHRANGKALRKAPPDVGLDITFAAASFDTNDGWQDEIRLMYGMLFTMKQMVEKLKPDDRYYLDFIVIGLLALTMAAVRRRSRVTPPSLIDCTSLKHQH
jgi:hypothetical protein